MHRDNIDTEENSYVLAPYRELFRELGLKSLNRGRVNSVVLWIHKIIIGCLKNEVLRLPNSVFGDLIEL